MVPTLCNDHARAALGVLGIGREGTWQAAIMMVNLLHFQNVMRWERATLGIKDVHQTTARYPSCWGCAFPRTWDRTMRVALGGLSHIAAVSHGQNLDPDGPFSDLISARK